MFQGEKIEKLEERVKLLEGEIFPKEETEKEETNYFYYLPFFYFRVEV